MILLLSPSKTFSKSEEFHEECPHFMNQSIGLMRKLKSFTAEDLQKKMKISLELAQDVVQYHHEFGKKKSCAIYSYAGYAYKAFDASSLTREDLDYLRFHMYIISGLYGLVRPFDGISFYRLEMQEIIVGNLYHFWAKKINHYLNNQHKNDILINLASKEYSKVIDHTHQMITIHFYQKTPEGLKQISMYVKRARGLMARAIIKSQIEDPNLIKLITFEGYHYHTSLSTDQDYVFVKDL